MNRIVKPSDVEAYSRCEKKLSFADKLLEAEQGWACGDKGCTIDELMSSIDKAIERGVCDGAIVHRAKKHKN